jgi:hypothetical protein
MQNQMIIPYPALSDPDYFSVQSDGGSVQSQTSDATVQPPTSPFVAVAGAFVATTSFGTAVAFSSYAAAHAPAAIATFMSIGGEAAVIGSAAAISDIGGMFFVGALAGAGGGVVLLAPLGVGYGVGTLISPWVNSNLIDPLYPLFGLPKY